jgi:LacI family transcriptional regulator
MAATLKEVSLLAGVSLTTVSHVVNGTRVVSPEARARVQEAIRQTGYVQNNLARSLKTASSGTIGLAIQDIRNPYFTDVVSALEAKARDRGVTILLSDFGLSPEHERDALRVLVERRVDGLVVAPSADGRAALEWLRSQAMPVVQIDRVADPAFDYVVAANTTATRDMVRHLIEIGHRRIAMLVGLARLSTTRERLAGYRRALLEAGIAPTGDLVVEGCSQSEPGRVATHALIERAVPPTAIVAGNNLMALGAMRALRERGLAVPDDIALVSFDDFEWADLFQPRLTTIAQPCQAIGERAIELLFERIANPGMPPCHVRLPAVIRHRESCGCGRHDASPEADTRTP